MANTYTQIYLHVVFAVEGRQNLIAPAHNDELQKYITGIVTAQKHKLSLAWNTTPGMSSKRATNECPNMSPLTGLGGSLWDGFLQRCHAYGVGGKHPPECVLGGVGLWRAP